METNVYSDMPLVDFYNRKWGSEIKRIYVLFKDPSRSCSLNIEGFLNGIINN